MASTSNRQFPITVGHVPDQLAAVAVPGQPVVNGGVRIRSQDLFSAVFLRSFENLVGINLQEGRIKNLRIGIVGIIVAIASGIDSTRRGVLPRRCQTMSRVWWPCSWGKQIQRAR